MGAAESNNVTVLEYQGKTIHLVGTAHVSQRSVEEVTRVIRSLRPDTVCVELDRARFESLTDPTRYRRLNIFELIAHHRLMFTLGGLVLTSYQRRMGAKLGVMPGAELLAGVTCAREVGAELVLADRDVQVTLKRSWARLGLSDKAQLTLAMGLSLFTKSSEISAEQIEALKDRDTIQEMMSELAKHMPSLQVPLIDERDRYLVSAIREAPGPVIVGVVGAGHVSGMLGYLHHPIDRGELATLPHVSPWAPFRPWVRASASLAVLAAATLSPDGVPLLTALTVWWTAIGCVTALATLAMGAHVLTAFITGLLAPGLELLPVHRVSSLSAWLEAKLRTPSEKDCEQINEALLSFRQMRANRFIRILLLATVGAFAARACAFLAAAWLLFQLLLR